MKTILHKYCDFELKNTDDTGAVQGYGSVFGNVDQGGDIVAKGAFSESLTERLPKMLWGHDAFSPAIGVWTGAKEDDHGLLLDGKINMQSAMGQEVHASLKMGAVDGLSIGYWTKDSDTDRRGITTLKKVDLLEVSFVNFPMNIEARVDAVKSKVLAGTFTKKELETILCDAGLSRSQSRAVVSKGFAGLKQCDAVDDLTNELKTLLGRINHGC